VSVQRDVSVVDVLQDESWMP